MMTKNNAVGRIVAVCEKVEEAATGKHTMSEKLFEEATTNPQIGLSRLLGYITANLMPILQRKNPVLADKYNRHLSELAVLVGDSMPNRLPLHEQGEVQLGYYAEMNGQEGD